MSTAANSALFNAVQFNQMLFGGAAAPAGSITVQVGQGILYPALRKAGVTIGPGRTPSPAQFQDAFDELNRLIGSLNCDRLFIYSLDTMQYPLDPPKMSYTIGQPADSLMQVDFETQRPQLIEQANLISGNSRYPLKLASEPRAGFQLYNDRAFPVSTLYFSSLPAAGQSLELITWHQVPYVSALTDVVIVPMQYIDALVLNLACRLAPHFQLRVDADLRQQARDSLMRLESINAPMPIADTGMLGSCGCDGGGFSSGTGTSGGSGGGGSSTGTPGPPGPQGPAGVYDIQDEGSVLPRRAMLNFVGAGVTVADDAANNASVITVPAPYDIVYSLAGKPGAAALVLILTATRAVTFAGNLAGSRGTVGVNPTATATYTINKNGSAIGTIAVSTGGAVSFTTTGGAAQSLAIGDRLTISAPSSQDATLSDVGFTLAGTR